MPTITKSPGTKLWSENGGPDSSDIGAYGSDTLILEDGTWTCTDQGFGGICDQDAGDCDNYEPVLQIQATGQNTVTIRAKNPGKVILDGQNRCKVVAIISGEVILEGLVITNGRAGCEQVGPNDDGVSLATKCGQRSGDGDTSASEVSTDGGGIYVGPYPRGQPLGTPSVQTVQTDLTVQSCTIRGNDAANQGGGVYFDGATGSKLTIKDTTISGNTASGPSPRDDGTGEYIDIDTLEGRGGGVIIKTDDAFAIFDRCTISGNNAAKTYDGNSNGIGGGGLDIQALNAAVMISDTIFNGNTIGGTATKGSAIYAAGGTLSFSNVNFTNHLTAATIIDSAGTMSFTCPLGKWMSTSGAITENFDGCAFDCLTGTYGASPDLTAASECTTCPASTTSAAGAASEAECSCPALRYWKSAGECAPCPAGMTTDTPDSTACMCPAGTFADANADCVECPSGVACGNAGAGVTIATLPLKPNYWRVSPNSTDIGPCYTADVCIGATAAQSRITNTSAAGRMLQSAATGAVDSSSTFGDSLCRIGHTGAFCEQCVPTYHKDPSGLCNGCNAAGGNVGITLALPIALVVSVIIGGIILLCRGRKKAVDTAVAKLEAQAIKHGKRLKVDDASDAQGSSSVSGDAYDTAVGHAGDAYDTAVGHASDAYDTAVGHARSAYDTAVVLIRGKIFLSLVQVLSQMSTVFSIKFPAFFSSLLKWIGLIQLDIFTLMPLECLFPTNFHTTLLLRTIIPLIVMLVLGLAGLVTLHMAGKTTNLRTKASRAWLGNMLMTLLFVTLFLIYPSVCSAIFSTFQCKTLGDGSRMLRVDLLIDCDSAAHQGMTGYATLMVLVYALGAPLLYSYLLFGRFGKTLRRLRDIEAERVNLAGHAKAHDQYDRFDKAKGEMAALTSTTVDSIEEQLLALKGEEAALRAELPAYIRSLSGNGYAKRAFFFEIIECLRKLSIVCVPVLFETGSTHQLLYAQAITFLVFGAYAMVMPYAKLEDNYYALAAQAIIFFNLMSSLAQPLGAGMDTALSTLLFGFIALSVLLSMPSLKKLCAKRAKTNTATTSSSSSTEKTDNADLKA